MPEHGTWESLRHHDDRHRPHEYNFREHIFGERPFEQAHYDMHEESHHDRQRLDLSDPLYEAAQGHETAKSPAPHHEETQKKSSSKKTSEKKAATPTPSKAKKPVAQKSSPKKSAPKTTAKKSNDDDDYFFEEAYYPYGDYSDYSDDEDDYDRHYPDYEDSSDDEYPVYPYQASIFYDVAKGYDIYYDPLYESPFDTEVYDQTYLDGPHRYQEDDRYTHHRDQTYAPRSHRRNDMGNETPMYVRPFLEDPIFLQPDDDEVELLHQHEDHHEEEEHERAHGENGFRNTGERCDHDFECISGKCLSWLHKAPVCMPF